MCCCILWPDSVTEQLLILDCTSNQSQWISDSGAMQTCHCEKKAIGSEYLQQGTLEGNLGQLVTMSH